jgi:bis(5'-nucleosidyl)-tetraphosphatase
MMPVEKACGIIVVYKGSENLYLLLEQKNYARAWSFPKGHIEEGEDLKVTALRELKEEAGITDIELLDLEPIHEEYIANEGPSNTYLKTNEYFIGFVKDMKVTIQEEEILSYKWAPYEEAFETFPYPERKEVLNKARAYIENYESRE